MSLKALVCLRTTYLVTFNMVKQKQKSTSLDCQNLDNRKFSGVLENKMSQLSP